MLCKYNNVISDFFICKNSLFQVLSPILFSMYVNDCEMQLISDNCPYINIQMLNIFLIMYADDMVLLVEKPEGLQKMINSLFNYTQNWNLTVNTNKTKIVVFRDGGKLRDNEKWYFNGCKLDVVNLFILVFYFFITVNLHVHRNDLQNKDGKHYFQY